jgi:hypothetical protein
MTDEKQLEQINSLADKVLEVVMNTELESVEAALAALLHVSTTLAVAMHMSERDFVTCALECFQAGKEATQEHEVH